MSDPKHILVVDHVGDVRQVIADLLLNLGYVVSLAKDEAGMRALLDADAVDLVVMDGTVAGTAAVNLAMEARDRGIRLVMISGRPDLMELFQGRADQLLWKPFGRGDLERAVNHALASEVRGQRKEDPP